MNTSKTMQVTKSLAMSGMVSGGMVCINGDDFGKHIPLESDVTVKVGRDASVCKYVVNASVISRQHMKVKFMGTIGKYVVTDLSSNGTYLSDGSRMIKGKEYYFSSGDEIMLGNKHQVYKFQ